jgi:hypothetical protein
MRKYFHYFMAFFWIVMTIPTLLWWSESVLLIALMSIYANVAASFAAAEASNKK